MTHEIVPSMLFPPIQTMSSRTGTGRAEFSNRKIEDTFIWEVEGLSRKAVFVLIREIKNIYLSFFVSLNVSHSESEIRERFYRAR